MSQLHTPAAPQQQPKTTPAPVPSAPLPLDPHLLRQVSGGTTGTASPVNNW